MCCLFLSWMLLLPKESHNFQSAMDLFENSIVVFSITALLLSRHHKRMKEEKEIKTSEQLQALCHMGAEKSWEEYDDDG